MTNAEKLDMAIDYIETQILEIGDDVQWARTIDKDHMGVQQIIHCEQQIEALTYAVKVLEKARMDE